MKLLAIATVITSVATTLVGLLLIARAPSHVVPLGYRIEEMLPFVVLQLAFTVVGALLVLRRPKNRVGHYLCGTALVSSALIVLSGLAVDGLASGDTASAGAAAWVTSWAMLGIGATLGPAMVIFPDGRVRSGAARASLVALAITVAFCMTAIAFRPGPLTSFPTIPNPYPLPDQAGVLDLLLRLGFAAGLAATFLGLGSQIARYRHSSGVEREQLKWFLASAVFQAVTLIPAVALLLAENDPGAAPVQRWAGRAIGATATVAIPVAVGVAILRYRLYDIDLLIRRTLVYAGVSAVLAATYIAAVVLTGAALRPFTAGSDLAVAASTLVVVALFQPLRQRLRDFVDSRFYRSRYDAVRTVGAFSVRLRDEVDIDAVRADLIRVVHDTVQPTHARLWLR